MIRAKWIVLVMAMPLLLTSCGVPVKNFTCEQTLESSQSSQSDRIDIAIHVDGSGSMLGYVANDTNRYIQILKLLDETFSLGGSRPNQTVKYYRSGKNSQKITRSDFRKAQLPEFYDGSSSKFPGVTSGLDSAITPPENGDKLFVMVTDLYQNDADITILNKKIKDTYLNNQKKGYAVGIVAIRSEFKGTVYVEGNKQEKFTYNTEGKKPENFRPFYVMFLGPYRDITYYFDKLKRDGGELLEGSQMMIVSPDNLVSTPSYIGEPQQPLPQDLKQPSSLNNGKVAIEVENNQKVQLLEIDKNPAKELPINYSVDFTPLNYSLSIDPNSIKLTQKIEFFDPFDKQFKEQSNNPTIVKALQFSGWKQTDNKLNFISNIRASNLQDPGIYLFTFDAVAKGLQEPSWWEEWTLNASRDSKNDGSKTHNLSNFLRGLKTITTELMEENPPTIGRFCFAIQKN